jgi:hypothetical protein
MTNDKDEVGHQQRLLDTAIDDCRSNIFRHSLTSGLELLVAVGIICVLAITLLKLAELQGEENDTRKRQLEKEVSEAKDAFDSAKRRSERTQAIIPDLEKANAEAAADPKRIPKIYTETFNLLQRLGSGIDLVPVGEMGKRDPSIEAPLLKGALEQALVQVKTSVASRLEDEKLAKAVYEKLKTDFQRKSPPVFTDTMLYGTGVLFVVIIGVFTGLYRFHLREVTKNEQYKLGLLRIRVAANSASLPGFDGEVRTALTSGAFDLPREPATFLARGRIESPVPGHPSSDIATLLLNRLLEEVEVVLQPKPRERS